MPTKHRFLGLVLLPAVLAAPSIVTGCATHRGYETGGAEVRVYDTDHSDYHVWNNNETVFYSRWEGETHREHRDFNRRPDDEQREYWKWRHSHS